MKWDTIKNKCVREACTEIRNLHQTNITKLSLASMLDDKAKKKYDNLPLSASLRLELMDEVIKMIDAWDVRQYQGLRKVFPKAFPKIVTGIDLGDNGWVVY